MVRKHELADLKRLSLFCLWFLVVCNTVSMLSNQQIKLNNLPQSGQILHAVAFSFPSIRSFLCSKVCSRCLHKVLDGSESQYSGMQIGTLQDEEDEGSAPPSQEEPLEPFLQPVLGAFQM